jgi:hypothetical protein
LPKEERTAGLDPLNDNLVLLLLLLMDKDCLCGGDGENE